MRRIASITFRPRHGASHEVGALWQDERGVRLLVSRAIKPLEDARDRRERRAGLLSIRAGLERVDELPSGAGERFGLHPAQDWTPGTAPMRFREQM